MKDKIKLVLRHFIPRGVRIKRQFKMENNTEKVSRIQILNYLKEHDIPGTSELVSYLKSHRIGVFNYFWADKHIYAVNRIRRDKYNGLYYAILWGGSACILKEKWIWKCAMHI